MSDETYPMPIHGWTCFHCGETFKTPGCARQHFGETPDRQPGCIIKVELGGERGLLGALRKAEDELARYRNEDSDTQRQLVALQFRHSEALRAAEETGYARGLRDTPWKVRALAAEERMKFMTMPREFWDDLWDSEKETAYNAAKDRHAAAVEACPNP